MKPNKLTTGERIRWRALTFANRIVWLWRRPKGCECDPDGYGLRDIPQRICVDGIHDFTAPPEAVAFLPFLLPWDTCVRCGHDDACCPPAVEVARR